MSVKSTWDCSAMDFNISWSVHHFRPDLMSTTTELQKFSHIPYKSHDFDDLLAFL